MPLELGLFLGAKFYGNPQQRQKKCIVLDKEAYRYQKFISDIAGQDVTSHDNDIRSAVIAVRNWLGTIRTGLPSGTLIWQEYEEFLEAMPVICESLELDESDLTFLDYRGVVYYWLEDLDVALDPVP